MKLATFRRGPATTFGCIEGDQFIDFGPNSEPGTTLRDILPLGLSHWQALAASVATADRVPFDKSLLLAPVPNARKYLGLGGNYGSHVAEAERLNFVRPTTQTWFNKQITSINDPYGNIDKPFVSDQLDYEGELGVVICKDGRHITERDAWDHVAGYVVCNDVSVRDWQLQSPTHQIGKSFDTHGPFGPWIVTRDEIPDPHVLALKTWVNGDLRQNANTSEMIERVPTLISHLTKAFTLQTGDILATGTPSGVGGLFDPPRFLRAGDVVRVEIEGIGHIENRVVTEPAPAHSN